MKGSRRLGDVRLAPHRGDLSHAVAHVVEEYPIVPYMSISKPLSTRESGSMKYIIKGSL